MPSGEVVPPVPRAPIARVVGDALGAAFAVVRKIRRPRPIHARGVVLRGEIRWLPHREPAGLSFVDEAPARPVRVVARVSRSLGLPSPLPDIIGLAVRIDANAWGREEDADVQGPHGNGDTPRPRENGDAPAPGDTPRPRETGDAPAPGDTPRPRKTGDAPAPGEHGDAPRPLENADAPKLERGPDAAAVIPADIEFASTGWGVPARFALLAHRRAERARLGILFPYLGARGPVLLGARTFSGRPAATDPRELTRVSDGGWTLTLGHATPLGRWHPFALLELHLDRDQRDAGLRFDAVRHPIPGARTYAWVRAARQPSYLRTQPADVDVRMPDAAPAEGSTAAAERA